MYASLGAVDGGQTLEETLQREGPARAYIRDRWAAFLDLGPRIIDLQHRAAELAYRLGERGDLERKAQAQQVIKALGALNVKHGEAVDRFELESVGEALGLSGFYRGLGAVPFVPVAVVTSLALVVAWAFRAYDAEARKLDLIEAGLLTPTEAAALDAGPAPGTLFAGLEGLGKLALYGALAFFAVQLATVLMPAARARGSRRNPPLEVWHLNPPGVFGDEVYDVRYRHSDDGHNYIHEFGDGVELEGLEDGTVLLSHRDGLPLWREF